ncbi:MAG: DUF2283 domain-containing protein [Actinomycetota bacterium]|nr:DUF2283 domain-containing protein [Actinomycetota bacterium]
MNIRYDPESGAGYIRVREGRYGESLEIAPGCYLAIAEDGQVMGLEFLSLEELAEAASMRAGGLDLPDHVKDPEAFHLSKA